MWQFFDKIIIEHIEIQLEIQSILWNTQSNFDTHFVIVN